MSITKNIAIGAAVMELGCGVRHDTRPPTTEEQVIIDQIQINRERSQPTVDYLVQASKQNFFDSQGEMITTTEFIADLHTRGEQFKEFNETGRILMMTDLTDTVQENEVEAYERSAMADKNDVLAINPELLKPSAVGTCMHEISHTEWLVTFGPGGHSQAMIDALTTDINGAITVAWSQHDFAYENNYVYKITDALLLEAEEWEGRRIDLLDQVTAGSMTTEAALLEYQGSMYLDQEDWLSNNGIVADNDNPYYLHIQDFFAWTPEVIKAGLREGNIYETVAEQQELNLAELKRELREYSEANEAAKSETRREGQRR